ncbi:MAG: adenosylcobinamide-phosphate synthase CbiB [Ardenticatenia bacterium]|nr:adenosylcobinamide-phosphate synthase CbiB [Ardenticatenia bacterium]
MVVAALLLDLLLGDPPNRYHPVAWMGVAMNTALHQAPRHGDIARLAYGAFVALGGTLFVAWLGHLVARGIARLPSPWRQLVAAIALKTTFSLRGLVRAATQVQQALEHNDLERARRLLAWHLVSRETASLDASLVAAAAIESVAENASDSVVAPLLYYAVGGLPAAIAYRFANTADAMLGYRDAEREWLGKGAARLDDVLNWLPARLTALLLVIAARLLGEDAPRAWHTWRRDARLTSSPNAGHPMAAAAGALGIVLEKTGHYRLGADLALPKPRDIGRAVRLLQVAVALMVLLVWPLSAGLNRVRPRVRCAQNLTTRQY